MNSEARNKLLNIKKHCELDKDLKISDLEKENAYLLIQVNKYKKQFAKLRPNEPKKLKGKEKHDIIAGLHRKVKSVRASHVLEKEKWARSISKYREKMIKHAERETFITARFIQELGKDKFIETANRLDNPDRKSRILSQEKREKFLSSDKYDK